ncbi:hypothetical protein ANRL4_00805 [Anaerolineae bacterium]|nr:hypothetical protein ANRL4_00805 [Anaerolineae bacterium]
MKIKKIRLRIVGVCALLLGAALLTFPGGSSGAQSAPTFTPFVATFGPAVNVGGIGQASATPMPILPTSEPSPVPTATPLPMLRADLMGIQIHPILEISAWWAMVDRSQFMGFKWIKVQVNWKEMEPEPGVFTQEFQVVGDNLFYSGQRGFKTLISVVNAPDWARAPEARGQENGPPVDPQAYVNFLNAIFDRWGTAYIQAVEIWNEPNLVREWTGAPKTGAAYKQYFDAAYKAIRSRSADIVVVTAGPAPAGDTADGSVNDRRWLRELYAAGLPITDPNLAIGIHPYGWANPPDARCCASQPKGWDDQSFFFFLDNIYEYRQIMLENGHGAGKLWATEFGWATFQGLRYRDHINGPAAIPPTDPGLGWMNLITEQQQAEYVIRAFELAQNGDLASFMGPMFLWNLNFASLTGYIPENAPSRSEAGFSILNSDWGTRPLYDYLQNSPKQ